MKTYSIAISRTLTETVYVEMDGNNEEEALEEARKFLKETPSYDPLFKVIPNEDGAVHAFAVDHIVDSDDPNDIIEADDDDADEFDYAEQSEAFAEGEEAYNEGKNIEDNPKLTSEEKEEWIDGWTWGKEQSDMPDEDIDEDVATRQYDRGFAAFTKGGPIPANPYVKSRAIREWRKGWYTAKHIRENPRG